MTTISWAVAAAPAPAMFFGSRRMDVVRRMCVVMKWWVGIAAVVICGCGPSIKQDVGEILFFRQGHLELLDTASGDLRPLTFPPAGSEDRQPSWSGDGSKLAFIRTSQESSSLMLLDLELDELRDLGGQSPSSPNIGPRSEVLYYSSEDPTYDSRDNPLGWDNGLCRHQLVRLDLRTGTHEPILTTDESTEGLRPLLSPDGSNLAFSVDTTEGGWLDGKQQLLDLNTGEVSDLLDDFAFGRAWLADSSGVFFATVGLWFGASDAEPVWLSENLPTVLQIEASPSADRIAFTTSQLERAGDDFLTRCVIETATWPDWEQEGTLHQAPDGFCLSPRGWSPTGDHLLITTWDLEGSHTSDDPHDEDVHQLVDVLTGETHTIAVGDDVGPTSWRPAP